MKVQYVGCYFIKNPSTSKVFVRGCESNLVWTSAAIIKTRQFYVLQKCLLLDFFCVCVSVAEKSHQH